MSSDYKFHEMRCSARPVNTTINYLGEDFELFPTDVIKAVTVDNWEELFDRYMVIPGNADSDFADEGKHEYVWKTDIMKEFIKALVSKIS